MINLLLLLLLLTCLGITAAWIAENPGNVTINWFDYRIETSFAFLLLLALLCAFILSYAYIIGRRLVLASEHFTRNRDVKKYKKGLQALTQSVAALAAADPKNAELHTRKAEKLLGTTPLTLLLSAQIARSQGEDEKTKTLLTEMLKHKETEYIAARYLSDAATKQRQYTKALTLAQRAHTLNPSAIASVVSLHVRLGSWQEALHAIDKSLRKGGITRHSTQRYKGLLHLKQGMQLQESGQSEAALASAHRAVKLLPEFPPAIALLAQTLLANKQPRKAINLIARAWKHAPHPMLLDIFRASIGTEPKAKQMKLVRQLISGNPDAPESAIALAETAILNQEWAVAQAALTALIAKSETVHACKLMSEVVREESSDFSAANSWLQRSADALPDPSWVCHTCGHSTTKWDTHCPSCGEFDSLEWKKRELVFAGERPL